MANETDTPSGEISEEGKQTSVQNSGELSFRSDQPQSLSKYAPPWLRMDPELSRAVLAKTEEELLGSLSALMRNKIEHEKAQRALAHTLLEIEQARQEVAGVKRQVVIAEDELNTRMAEHGRVVDEISHTQDQLQTDRSEYLQFHDELIAIKKEIEEARSEKNLASTELAELQLQQRSVRSEIESLKTEVAALQGERRTALEQVEPIRKELDERLSAREAIIQQITVMERHLAELTSTRDVRANAQRVALVGRRTESMREEIKRVKEEIERIEKERVRLANERDRVESEFAGLENRLNSARFTYAETLERLDEARAALAVTEKEHDDVVSKLIQTKGQQTKAVEARQEPMVANDRERLEPSVSQVNLPPIERPPGEKERDAVLTDQGNLPPVEEPVLPLLKNQPLPPVTPRWNSYRLESEFFTEERLDANRVAHLVSELPGIENTLVLRQRGAVLGGDLPQRLSDQLKTPGRDYELLFKNWPNRVQERKSEGTQTTTFQAGAEFLTVTQAEDIFLVASHEGPRLHRGVEEKLTVVAEELAKMYPASESGMQESLVERKPDPAGA